MLQTETSTIRLIVQKPSGGHLELSRLMAAATVNPVFARLLLDDPEAALKQGYQDETFFLSEEERALISSIRADSLAQLAQILVRTLDEGEHIRMYYPAQTEHYPMHCGG
jgi:hypothetical protein